MSTSGQAQARRCVCQNNGREHFSALACRLLPDRSVFDPDKYLDHSAAPLAKQTQLHHAAHAHLETIYAHLHELVFRIVTVDGDGKTVRFAEPIPTVVTRLKTIAQTQNRFGKAVVLDLLHPRVEELAGRRGGDVPGEVGIDGYIHAIRIVATLVRLLNNNLPLSSFGPAAEAFLAHVGRPDVNVGVSATSAAAVGIDDDEWAPRDANRNFFNAIEICRWAVCELGCVIDAARLYFDC